MKEILITSSVLILLVLVLRLFLHKWVNRRVCYSIWLLVALRLLIPVQLGDLDFGILKTAEPVTEVITEVSRNPVIGPSRDEVYEQITQEHIQQGQDVSAPEVQQQIQTQVEQTITAPTVGQIATAVWIGGMALMAGWFLFVNISHSIRLRRTAEPVVCPESPVPVWVSVDAVSPCLVGLVRPVVYLTPESTMDPRSMRHVLTHELTHYRHGDHLWSLVRCVCLCVHWFNPLVWVAAVVSRRDCELACDEGALKRLGESERIPYGKTLLETVSHASKHTHLLQTATSMNESKRQLTERVNYIVKKQKVVWVAVVTMVLVSLFATACAFAGVAPASNEDPNPNETVAPTQEPTQAPTEVPTEPKPTSVSNNGYVFALNGEYIPIHLQGIAGLGNCTTGHLYYYDKDADKIIPLLAEQIVDCIQNETHVFYVKKAEPRKIYMLAKSDIINPSVLYETNFGDISTFNISGGLYGYENISIDFLEGNKRWVFFDLRNGEHEVLLEQYYIEQATIMAMGEVHDDWRDYNAIHFTGKLDADDTLDDYIYYRDTGRIKESPYL